VGGASQPRYQLIKQYPNRGSSLLRIGRFSQPGNIYFVTIRCYKSRKIFIADKPVKNVFESIEWLIEHSYIDLYFCVIMPDHMHMIFSLVGTKSLSEVMKSLKQFTSRKIKNDGVNSDPIWQEQYYDHAIRRDENLLEIIKYCWYNPVRAGLVTNPNDYPYWKSMYALE
jgi:putative transposase